MSEDKPYYVDCSEETLDLLIRIIHNLLDNRDALGVQLAMAHGNIDADTIPEVLDKYLKKEPKDVTWDEVSIICDFIDREVDEETLATMLGGDIEQIETLIKIYT
jgi:hypothetical protein